jgi:hypothetical protein
MTRAPRRIREYRTSGKDHPGYRKVVETEGWIPHILCDATACYWDGLTVRDDNGKVTTGISEPARDLLVVLIQAGRYGDNAQEAFLDPRRYERISEDLLTWPNEDIIARESLRVLEMRPPR